MFTPLPTPVPSTADPTNFDARADAFLGALPLFQTEMDALGAQATADAAQTAADRVATTSASATAMAAANYKGAWSAQSGAANVPYSVSHLGKFWILASNLANVAAKTPGTDPEWLQLWFPQTRRAQTTSATLSVSDAGNIVACTGANSPTWTIPAAATFGAATMRLVNDGTGDVTLVRSGSNTLDGLTGYVMYPGETRDFTSDGSAAWTSVVVRGFSKTFTASGTFTTPPGYQNFAGELWSAGASGRKDGSATNKAGGGGGSCAPFVLPAATFSATEAVTIGAGGAAVTINATSGNNGGDSTFKGVTAKGGQAGTPTFGDGGLAYDTPNNPATAGLDSGNVRSYSYLGGGTSSGASGAAFGAVWGGGGGGAITSSDTGLTGGASVFGGQGGAAVLAGNGVSGTAPGGGGGATKTGTQSGAGARGELRIRGVC